MPKLPNIKDIRNIKSWTRRGTPSSENQAADVLEIFGPEHQEPQVPQGPASVRHRFWLVPASVIILGLGLTGGLGLTAYVLQKWRPFQVEAASASLTIESEPAGAEVLSAGAARGSTPLTILVAPGDYTFEVVHDGRRRPLKVAITAGAAVVHHVLFDSPVASNAGSTTASLRIATEPAKLRVAVDGVPRGVSPLTVGGLKAGVHTVQVTDAARTIERQVEVAAGETASVILSAPPAAAKPAGPAAGWLTVSSPIALDIFEGATIVGTSQSSKIMLPVGRHELGFKNEGLGFSDRRLVQVTPGATAAIRVDVPTAPLSINAQPWAEAWVDGKRVGETPIGNHKVRLGTHEIVLRHPELGERRQTVTVSLTTPARVSVDMRKP